jgi:hypothetical protein
MMLVMVVVVGFAVEVCHCSQRKEYEPAQVERFKILYHLANNEQNNIRHDRHDQTRHSDKLVGVHLPRIVYLG